MAIVLVEHDRPEPALYGAMAAVVARARGADAMHLPARFEEAGADAVQHVTADGALVPSGLVWFERITGLAVTRAAIPEDVIARGREHEVVVPVARCVGAQAGLNEALFAAAAEAGITVERIRVEGGQGKYRLVDPRTAAPLESRNWTRDAFGRLEAGEATRKDQSTSRRRIRIVVLGAEADHRDVYPATLAALGDAADAANIALDVIFVPPTDLRAGDVADIVAAVDGVLLPGGSNMANVPGQILMAGESMRTGKPTVGLCLGMQTMVTAIARRTRGLSDANLAEIDPDAPIKTFVPLVGDAPDRHRLGEQAIVTVPGSRLQMLLGPKSAIRSNHRYKLNPDLLNALRSAGLAVTASDTSGTIAEGIELSGHPFFVGMQGHPELMSCKGAPHALLTAFVEAAASGEK
jgi:gamma-glutamyl-gamma-aminobutyrate hydrolase PuuD